ncbi:unnamed protein product, partial [Ixodes hexagonus]
ITAARVVGLVGSAARALFLSSRGFVNLVHSVEKAYRNLTAPIL